MRRHYRRKMDDDPSKSPRGGCRMETPLDVGGRKNALESRC
ncbi:hypothetical protein Godav_022096 [Gossypium davidsonii]|uniref:Uncharacterized protein n=1 Tax=Gossypium davidsonii TaxID=34287 RepID=A0A7J8TF70_GOSDV|nr:hypothetical protein [Gossypium davidsonii]